MHIVFDTCCLIDGILGNDAFAASIITLQHQGKFKFALSEQLLLEYIFVPLKLAEQGKIPGDKAYKLAKLLAKVISNNSEIFKVKSKGKYVLNDSEDDKLIHLAIDANCPYIITSNSSDFFINDVKSAKTKTGLDITILNPYQFYTLYRFKKLKNVT